MIERFKNSAQARRVGLVLVLAMALVNPSFVVGDDKKKKSNEPEKVTSFLERIDKSEIVWPQPPNVTRVKYLDYFAGEKLPDFNAKPAKSKSQWMDRLAGTTANKGDDQLAHHFFMGEPHGVAVDSKGNLYVADGKVGGIFIINPETHDTQMIQNGRDASFALIIGLAIDDTDRLFVSDAEAHRILIFSPQHKAEASIKEGLVDPSGMAIDNENRFLYVADVAQDQVLVYDADNFQLLRRIGTPNTKHASSTPGDFSKPTGVAVDSDGNLYVADMLNARIEVFDADGNFIRAFGKRGDGPGYFAMPKNVAIDSDGHLWVTDSMQNRIQIYSQEGQLLMFMGSGTGILPGMFSGLQGITIDKTNRVFTTEVFPGRVQEFRYITQDEARAEQERRDAAKASKTPGSKPAPVEQKAASPATGSGAPKATDSAAK
jgi:sugar lactone lactonase YvrE